MTLWLVLDELPCPTVSATGIRSGFVEQHWIEETDDVTAPQPAPDKPPYRVPLMSEIAALPWNGLTVVSTFAGCGGSSTGYRMAGFRILWASEFVEAARDVYALNAREGTIIDGRDIRAVQPDQILAATGLAVGELDVLDGSPPCASFSTAGRRQAKWGKVSKYSDTEQRSDDLFFEFARILKGLQPRAFVAENVSGLVKGTAKGYFIEILRALKACGYRVEAKLLDAQWLGVPQQRQRLIFVGVREDLGVAPAHPTPLPYRYSVREALPHIGTVVHDTSGLYGAGDITNRPSPAVTVGVHSVNSNHFKVEDAVRVVPGDRGSISRRLSGEPYSIDEPMATVIADGARNTDRSQFMVETVVGVGGNGAFGEEKVLPPDLPARTIGSTPSTGNGLAGGGDVMVERIVGIGTSRGIASADEPAPTVLTYGRQATQSELTVVERVVQGAKAGYSERRGEEVSLDGPAPTIGAGGGGLTGGGSQLVVERTPGDMTGYAVGDEYDKLRPGEQSDRFFSLVRPHPDQPSPAVTAAGGNASTASVSHPVERRKFTIDELKRICAFPDDFKLSGTYAQQWERLGRAVPPVMMSRIAATLRDEVFGKMPKR